MSKILTEHDNINDNNNNTHELNEYEQIDPLTQEEKDESLNIENNLDMVNNTDDDISLSLKVLQYNIFCRPRIISDDAQLERAGSIPNAIDDINSETKTPVDVVTICECFDDNCEKVLVAGMNKIGFYYHTDTIGEYPMKKCFSAVGPKLCNGGVKIFSRHKIINIKTKIFATNEISGTDSLASKGVIYAKIMKMVPHTNADGKLEHVPEYFHVFATHLQAWNTEKAQNNRMKELTDIRKFIEDLKFTGVIKLNEPIIISGDFNINYYKYYDEYQRMMYLLDVHEPLLPHGKYTSDPKLNSLVGRDGQKKPLQYEWLDYTFTVKDKNYEGLSLKEQTVKVWYPYKMDIDTFIYNDNKVCFCCFNNKLKTTNNFSDHFPVETLLKFKKKQTFPDFSRLFRA